jgi:hypothetical protein
MVKNEKLIDLAAIKYLPCEFIINRANTLEKIGSLCVNKNYSPLAFLVDNYLAVDSEAIALQKIQEMDLKKTLILEETPDMATGGKLFKDIPKEKIKELSLTDHKPNSWHFAVKTNTDTFLFLAQTNYPGWTAKIDGYPAKIYQADYLFQAVFVPKGEHEITMEYESAPLIKGTILTIIGLSVVFIIALYDLYQRKKVSKKEWEQTLKKLADKQI